MFLSGTFARVTRTLLVAVFASVLASGMVSAGIVDLVSSFPNTQGDSGFYAQAYNPGTESFRDLGDSGAFIFSTPGQSSGRPALGIFGGELQFWPSVNGTTYGTEWAVLTYVAPVAGSYSVLGQFYGVKEGNTTQAYVFASGSSDPLTPAGALWQSPIDNLASASFNLTSINLNAGDVIRFAVDARNGSHAYDTTALCGCINTPVPEPGSLAVVFAGLAGLAGIRRRS